MRQLTRRLLLSGVATCAILAVSPPIFAGEPIFVKDDTRICEREARKRIEEITQKMISAAEKRGTLTQEAKNEWLDSSWQNTRAALAQSYTFFD